jgi:hypothetical protein
LDWQREAACHVEAIEANWRSTLIDMTTRLHVSRGTAPKATDAHGEVFATLKPRGPPDVPPPTISHGWGGVEEAIVQVEDHVPPDSERGHSLPQKPPQAGWHDWPVVKQLGAPGRLLGSRWQMQYDEPCAVLTRFGRGTASVERTHLTMRHVNSRLMRKTLRPARSRARCLAPLLRGKTRSPTGRARSQHSDDACADSQGADGKLARPRWPPG